MKKRQMHVNIIHVMRIRILKKALLFILFPSLFIFFPLIIASDSVNKEDNNNNHIEMEKIEVKSDITQINPLSHFQYLPWREFFYFTVFLFSVLFVIILWYYPKKYHKLTYFSLDTISFHFQTGVWWRSLKRIPFSRVQYVDINSSPIERHFGLCTLIINTAGTSLANTEITGLLPRQATAIRKILLNRIGKTDGV